MEPFHIKKKLKWIGKMNEIFSLPSENWQKKSYKINQSKFHVIDSDNMLQMRTTNDL